VVPKRNFDVIVVGARVAGAATALNLARRGVKVLAVERATLPSDTLSSHQVQLPGVARLQRWGLLEPIRAAGTPAARTVRFDAGHVVLDGTFPSHDGVDALYSPRRTLLDHLLVDAARASGAEVREKFRVTGLSWADGRVIGVEGHERGREIFETARLVIGADGKHSLVARSAAASEYRKQAPLAFASYGYWSGMSQTAGELYQRPGLAAAVFPTNDDLTMVYLAAPIADFPAFRADIDQRFLQSLDQCGTLGERVRAATKAERQRTTPDQPNMFRVPRGPGWALVGDAGIVMDSISAQGISNALRDAELLSESIAPVLLHTGPSADQGLDDALRGYHRARDAAAIDMYDFTLGLARFAQPGYMERQFLASLKDRPTHITRFLGAFTGTLPVGDYFTTATAIRTLGIRGLARIGKDVLLRNGTSPRETTPAA
jgi:2-polyprenyl-6-methoxyphenol hydroxylase-like FAD-dependent oxidoreductase